MLESISSSAITKIIRISNYLERASTIEINFSTVKIMEYNLRLVGEFLVSFFERKRMDRDPRQRLRKTKRKSWNGAQVT